MYPAQLLVPIYLNLLRLTSGRGEHITIARIDAFLFRSNRKITINYEENIFIFLPPEPHFFRYLAKSHEQHVSKAIINLVKNGDVVVDIGADLGYFSAYAAAGVGKQGQVFCFEPEAKNFEYLKLNCELMQKSGFKCLAYQLAASSNSGKARLNVHRYSTYHAIEDEFHHLGKVESTQVINTVTLDQWAEAQGLKKIPFSKLMPKDMNQKFWKGKEII